MNLQKKEGEKMTCDLCPRGCLVDRSAGERGFCRSLFLPRVARSAPHFWEEPCLSGERGSGAIFFSGCTLKCAFCQNSDISRAPYGEEMDDERLAKEMLLLQEMGVHNINLVTAGHHLPVVLSALHRAKKAGLKLPVVYNCGGYETKESLLSLAEDVDIWLPDFKFFSPALAKEVAAAEDYPKICKEAISLMHALQPKAVFDENGIMQKGLIVRHLPLPGKLFDSKKIIDFVHSLGDGVWFSLLNQYTPMPTCHIDWLRRPLPEGHYDTLVDYCRRLGMERVFIQDSEAADAAFIPEFYDRLP